MRFYAPVGHLRRNGNATVKTFSSNGNNHNNITSDRQRTSTTGTAASQRHQIANVTQHSDRNQPSYLNEHDLVNSFMADKEIIHDRAQLTVNERRRRVNDNDHLNRIRYNYMNGHDTKLDNQCETSDGDKNSTSQPSLNNSLMDEEGE